MRCWSPTHLSTWNARRRCCDGGTPSTSGTNEMFSSTVRVGISLKSWKMKPMPRRYSWISRRQSLREVAGR